MNAPQFRYSDEDFNIIKGTFADNIVLLTALRNFLMQYNLNASELATLQLNFKDKPDVIRVLRRVFLPRYDRDDAFLNGADLWDTIGGHIKAMYPDQAIHHIRAYKLWQDYLDQQLTLLGNIGDIKKEPKVKIKLTELTDLEGGDGEVYVRVMARQNIISHITGSLAVLRALAGEKEESLEDTKKRLQKDSSK